MEWGSVVADPGVAAGKAYGNQGLFNTKAVWGGSNMALGPGTLGIWYNRPFKKQGNQLGMGTYSTGMIGNSSGWVTPTAGLSAGIMGYVTTNAFVTPQNQIDLIYGFKVGGADLGVGINRATNSMKEENTTNAGTTTLSIGAENFGISLGAALKELGAIKELDLGLQYDTTSALVSVKDSSGEEKLAQDGTEINFRAGVDLGGQLIDLNVNSQGRSTKVSPIVAPAADSYVEAKESAMDLNLGWAMSKSSDKGMGLGGFIFDMNNQSRDQANRLGAKVADKVDISTTSLDAVCGSEFKAKDWLTLRTGLSGTLYQSTNTSIDQNDAPNSIIAKSTGTSTAGRPAVITVGSSLIIGDVVIDAIANQDFLFSGPFFVSGVPNGLNLAVSATMKWGGAKE
jgi:hypothetical protein